MAFTSWRFFLLPRAARYPPSFNASDIFLLNSTCVGFLQRYQPCRSTFLTLLVRACVRVKSWAAVTTSDGSPEWQACLSFIRQLIPAC